MSVTSISRPESPTNLPIPVSSEMGRLARVQAVVLRVLSQNPEKSSSTLQDLAIRQIRNDQDTTQMVQSILKDLDVENLYQKVTNTNSLLESDEAWDLFVPSLSQIPHDQLVVAVEDFYLNALTQEIQKDFPFTSSEECKKILRASDFSISSFCYSDFRDAIRNCFKEQARILNYYFDLERNGKVFEGSSQNLGLVYYSRAQSLELWESFHEKYQTFFDWIKKNCSLSAEGDDIPQSSFTPFFLSHLRSIHANALIYLINDEEEIGFSQGNGLSLLYQEFQTYVFEKGRSIDEKVKIFLGDPDIYAKTALYETYKTMYPGTFAERSFSILYQKRKNLRHFSDEDFLKEEAKKEYEILVAAIWEPRSPEGLFLPRLFHSPESIQKMRKQLFEEIGRAEALLKPSLAIQDVWNMLTPPPVLLTYEKFKPIAIKALGYTMQIRAFISEHKARVEVGYADEEIKRFEETLGPKSSIEDSFSLFLDGLEKRLNIRAIIQITKDAKPTLNNSLTSLQKHLETLRQQNCSKEEEAILLHAIDRIILLDLAGFPLISPPRESDLSKRKEELRKILIRADLLLENPGSSLEVELKDSTEEYRQALYLAFIYVTTKKQMTTQYVNIDPEEKQRIQGHPMTSSLFVEDSFISFIEKDLSTSLRNIFGNSLRGRAYYSSNLEIEVRSFIKTLIHNFPKT